MGMKAWKVVFSLLLEEILVQEGFIVKEKDNISQQQL